VDERCERIFADLIAGGAEAKLDVDVRAFRLADEIPKTVWEKPSGRFSPAQSVTRAAILHTEERG
jgi:hypothetical protein